MGVLKSLLEKIVRVVVFHKTDFHRHLDLALTGASKHCCTCVRCGFHMDKNPIECPLRNEHIGPCSRCQEGFEVISKLYSLHSVAMERFGDNTQNKANARIVDDLATFKDEIDEILRNFEDYRAHLVHKNDEAWAAKERKQQIPQLLLGSITAHLTSDHKMKILEFYHREGQRGFFGKRGTSCLGMGIKMKSSSTTENSHLVQYHLFFSDDTTQDAHSVNCAKKVLFEHILKPLGVQFVDSSADGAGCLKSNVAKAMMSELTGTVTENTFHTSPPGCGKSDVDLCFAILSHHLHRLGNAGHSWRNARDLVSLLLLHPLRNTFVHLFEPDRSFKYETEVEGLNQLYFIENQVESSGIRGRVHSRHGDWQFYPYSEVKLQKTPMQITEEEEQQEDQQEDQQENDTEMSTCLPDILDGADLTRARKYFNILDEESFEHQEKNPPMILASSFPFGDVTSMSTKNSFERSDLPNQLRLFEKMNDNLAKSTRKHEEKIKAYHEKLNQVGIHCCKARDTFGSYCVFQTTSIAALEKHSSKGIHSFPVQSIESHVVNKLQNTNNSLSCLTQ